MTFTYTDTDSIHIMGKDYKKLVELGYIKDKKESSLGYLCSDIDNEGVIIYEKNLAPKSYKYEYVDNLNTTKTDDDSVMKYKGIPKKNLKNEYYEDEKAVVVEFSGLKKLNKKLTTKQREKEIKHFSIIDEDRTRTFHKSQWGGMIYKDNEWYPKGFELN